MQCSFHSYSDQSSRCQPIVIVFLHVSLSLPPSPPLSTREDGVIVLMYMSARVLMYMSACLFKQPPVAVALASLELLWKG